MRKVTVVLTVALMALMASSASAFLLTNGDFEDGGGSTTGWGGHVELNSTIHNPNDGPVGPNYGSAQAGGSNVVREMTQTVSGLTPGEELTLTGWIAGGDASPAPASWHAQLRDSGGGVLAEDVFTGPAAEFGFGWQQHNPVVADVPGDGIVVVAYRVQQNTSDWSNGTAIHADGAVLTPEPAGLALLGLAAVPMLLHRRRRA